MAAFVVIVATLVVFFGAMIAAVAVPVWLVTRSVRRSRRVTRARLMGRCVVAPHAGAREIARLRVSLFDAVTATSRVLDEVPAPQLLLDLAADLRRVAAATDRRLSLLGADPDPRVVQPLLPGLRDQVQALTRSAADVRATSWQFTSAGGSEVQRLTLEVADQLAGLRWGLAEVQHLRART